MPPDPSLTDEQQAIIQAGRAATQCLMIDALAGCGKTTTLRALAAALPRRPSVALAFGRKNATELKERLPQWWDCRSFHSMGYLAWMNRLGRGKVQIDDRKIGRILKELMKGERDAEWEQDAWPQAKALVEWAQIQGLGLEIEGQHYRDFPLADSQENWEGLAADLDLFPSEEVYWLAREALRVNIQEALQGTLSFDDQIYMSALYGGVFPRVPQVIVDEYQDLSPLQIIILGKVAGDRIFAAGDNLQAIYAWRGADAASRSKILALRPPERWTKLGLTLTFRCPKVVVQRQQGHAKGFRAHHSNREGSFRQLPALRQELDRLEGGWKWEDLPKPNEGGQTFVLCRNNAPLLKLAFRLIREGRGLSMLGRDIGKGLTQLSKKLFSRDSIRKLECLRLLTQWKDSEVTTALAKEDEAGAERIRDKADCLFAVFEQPSVNSAGELRTALAALFAKEDSKVILSTIHRAKGLEAEVVLILDPWRLPSKWAKEAGGVTLQQEMNLKYVGDTRSKDVLLYGSLSDMLEKTWQAPKVLEKLAVDQITEADYEGREGQNVG